MRRSAVVTEYRNKGNAATRLRFFTVLTWVATLGGGMFGIFNNTYKGEHVLSGVQRSGRKLYNKLLGVKPE